MKELLEKYSKAYYDGNPLISNEQYDALESIHGQIISGNGDTPHAYRMYSLQKHYEDEGESPVPVSSCIKTSKLDGAAVSILYVEGQLVHCLTRGNGIKGRNITNKMECFKEVPLTISLAGIVQITGEVVANSTVENSRNYASGALNQKNIEDFLAKKEEGDMAFIAYNIQNREDHWGIGTDFDQDMEYLYNQGFKTILHTDVSKYPTDGEVYRLHSSLDFNNLGFTDKFPRGSFALKERQKGVETTLLDVVWQTGKSGKVSPVAILEPIIIGEATVSRATLNNIAFIEALDLEIGCRVLVIRSGEIIPCIIGKVD